MKICWVIRCIGVDNEKKDILKTLHAFIVMVKSRKTWKSVGVMTSRSQWNMQEKSDVNIIVKGVRDNGRK